MALSEKTISKHNLKRAEVFKANGLCDMDVAFAHPAFVGYANDEQDCVLCGHRHIKWLFAIRFAAPDMVTMFGKIHTGITRTEEVTLSHVGSKCITDWLDAVPESIEKLEALKRWSIELDKCKAAMKARVVEQLCKEAGFDTPADAVDLWNAIYQQGLGRSKIVKAIGWKGFAQLRNNAYGIGHKTSTRSTVKAWLENLAKAHAALKAQAQAAPAAPAPTPAPAPAPVDPESDAGLLSRANALIASDDTESRVGQHHYGVLKDITAKVEKYGSFASSSQRNFLKVIIAKGEKTPVQAAPAPTATAKPGDVDYVSASGIQGARY